MTRPPNELAAARLFNPGLQGLHTEVKLAPKVENRVLLLLARDLLAALEQSGHVSSAVAQSRAIIQDQLAAWGIMNNLYVPVVPSRSTRYDHTIVV
jgi:hypothetical protein